MPSRRWAPEASLATLLAPRSIAVVGASMTNERTRDMLGNLRTIGFDGEAFGVNPRYDEILGFPCVPSLADLPLVPDAVAIGVSTGGVLDVVEEAAALGVAGAAIFAGGFGDARPEGARAERRLAEVAHAAGMAVVGPNCQGIVNFVARSALYTQQVHEYARGSFALVSQSGAVTDSLSTNTRGVRWSHVVSCGNEAVVDLADLLRYFVDDDECRGVCIFAEAIRDPGRFLAQCDRAREGGKPVILMRPGKTAVARLAAAAHSGALALPGRLLSARLERHGVLQADTLEEVLATALAFQTRRRPKGNGVAVVAGSGGVIQLILDEVEELELDLAGLAPETERELAAVVGPDRSRRNPLDIWPRLVADPNEAYTILLNALVRDANVHMILAQANFLTGPTGTPTRVGRIARFMSGLAEATDKPLAVITALEGEIPAEIVETALAGDVIPLSGIRSGLRALDHLAAFAAEQPPVEAATLRDEAGARSRLRQLGGVAGSGAAALGFAAACGLDVVTTVVAADPEEAAAAAARIGFPVVVKVGDAGSLHKTEHGGVVVGLATADDVRQAAERLLGSGASTLLVQPQLAGAELILGLERHEELGTFVLAGLGGVWAEVLDDVAILPVGLRSGDPDRMLGRLRGRPLLAGARGRATPDIGALRAAIHRVDAIGRAFGSELASLDLNPLIVSGSSATVVDALVVPSGSHGRPVEEPGGPAQL